MFRSALERQFRPADGGWTFIASYPRSFLFFRVSTYLVTDAQKAELMRGLARAYWLFLAFAIPAALALTSALIPLALWPIVDESWLPFVFALYLVLLALTVVPLLRLIYLAVEPVLSHAKRIGSATYEEAMERGNPSAV